MPDNYVEDPSVPSVQDQLSPVAFSGAGVGALDLPSNEPKVNPDYQKAIAQGIPEEMVGKMAMGNGFAAIKAPDGTIGYTEISNLSKAADKGFKLVTQEDYAQHRASVETKARYEDQPLEAAAQGYASSATAGLSTAITKGLLGGGAPTDYHQNLELGNDVLNQFQAQSNPAALNDKLRDYALDTAKRQEVDTRYQQYREGLQQANATGHWYTDPTSLGGILGVLTPTGAGGAIGKAGKGVAEAIQGAKAIKGAARVVTDAALFSAAQTNEQVQLADRPLMVSSVMANMGENFLMNTLIGGAFATGGGLLGKLVNTSRNASKVAQNLLDIVPGETPAEQLDRSYEAAKKVEAANAGPAAENLRKATKAESDARINASETKNVAESTRPRFDIEEKIAHSEPAIQADMKIKQIVSDIEHHIKATDDGRSFLPDLEYSDDAAHYNKYGQLRGKLEPPKRTDIPEEVAKAETNAPPRSEPKSEPVPNLTAPGSAKAKAAQEAELASGESRIPPQQVATRSILGVGGSASDRNLNVLMDILRERGGVPDKVFTELESLMKTRKEATEAAFKVPSLQESAVTSASGAYDQASQEAATAKGIQGAVSGFADQYKPSPMYGPKEVPGLVGASPGPATGLLGVMAQSAGRGVGWAAGHAVGGGMIGGLAAAHYFGQAAKKLIDVNTRFGQALRAGVGSIGVAAKKTAQASAAVGLKVGRAANITSPFQADKNKSYQTQAAEVIDKLSLAANDPAAIEGRMQEALTGLRALDPKLADAVFQQVKDTAQYLNDKAPKPPQQGQSVLPQFKWQPTDAEVSSFSHSLQAAGNPLVILDQIKNGTIVPETIDAVEKLHPDVARAVKEEIIQHLTEVKELPYKSRLALFAWMGLPLDPTLTPMFAEGMKAVWASEPNEPKKQGGFTAPTNPKKLSDQYDTQTAKFQ